MEIRYTNDLGNGHSGFVDSGDGIVVATVSGQPLAVELDNVETTSGTFQGEQQVLLLPYDMKLLLLESAVA